MEIWEAARNLGVGEFDPVVKGGRALPVIGSSAPTGRLGNTNLPVPPPRYEMPDRATWGNDPKEWDALDSLS